MEQTDSDQKGRRRREGEKEREGTRQRTCMNDPWTWTTGWELTVGAGVGGAEEGKGGEVRITVIG